MLDHKNIQYSKGKILGYVIPMLFVFAISLYFIKDNIIIKITGDEYGYWSAGAFFTGRDWSEVTGYNSYYSYGYGLILALILRLNLSASISYQLAIALNGLFLCGIYAVVRKVINRLSAYIQTSEIEQIFLALAATTYTGILYYTQYTVTEVLLSLLYWEVLLLALLLLEKVTFLRSTLFSLTLMYMFSVHQRTIGVCFVGALFLISLIFQNKIDIKFIVKLLIVIMIVFIAILGIKYIYQSLFFSNTSVDISGNDFSGQVGKLSFLFSISGIWMFIKAFAGKVFYALSATYLMGGVVLIVCGYGIYDAIKEKKWLDSYMIFYMFLILNAAAMMAVGSIFMINYYGRVDLLIYGRYFEFTLGPLFFVGIMNVKKHANLKKILLWVGILVSAVYLIIALLINYIIDYSASTSNLFVNCSGIARVFYENDFGYGSVLFCALIKIIIFIVLVGILSINNSKMLVCALIGMILLFCDNSRYIYETGCLSWSKKHTEDIRSIEKYINTKSQADDVYYYMPDGLFYADLLQFIFGQQTLHVFNEEQELQDVPEDTVIITGKESEASYWLEEDNYYLVETTESFCIWEK